MHAPAIFNMHAQQSSALNISTFIFTRGIKGLLLLESRNGSEGQTNELLLAAKLQNCRIAK